MKVDEIWRFQLVRGFTNDISRGACLLTAVSWLVHGRHSDQPPGVCRLLARCGREVNDILANEDRQRLKVFICRLAGSKDNEAMGGGHVFSSMWSCEEFWKQKDSRLRADCRLVLPGRRRGFLFSLAGGGARLEKLSMRSAGAIGKPKVDGRSISSILSAGLSTKH
jgi:hypothetical protein